MHRSSPPLTSTSRHGLYFAIAVASSWAVSACGDSSSPASALSCESGELECGGACVHLTYSPAECDGVCVSLASDPRHCGGCGAACDPGEVCVDSRCVISCPLGLSLCGQRCVDTSLDPAHCGDCDTACDAGELCRDSDCQLFCPSGFTDCSGTCTHLASDPLHCGACGEPCAAGEVCSNGDCLFVCQQGTACDGACVDILTDESNCGGCGRTCAGGASCVDGGCKATCAPGLAACGEECFDIDSDPTNCGACGRACAATETCDAGSCVPSCVANLIAPVTDPWGETWSLERAAVVFADAQASCEAIGGRLPTATELWRVAANNSGAVGQSFHTNYLWTLNPHDHNNRFTVRLSDGDATPTTDDMNTRRAFRCVCPDVEPKTFSADACNGPAGSTCFAMQGGFSRYAMDASNRAPLSKSGALWECVFNRGHLADFIGYAEAIQSGLPNGTGAWAHTADDATYQYDTVVRWSNVDTSWNPDGNTSVGNQGDRRPFRCMGVTYEAGTHPNAVANEWVGPTSGYKGERTDRAAATWVVAHDTCTALGGHLPRQAELGELVQQGLPNGSGGWLWSADQHGYNGTQFLAGIVSWNGTVPRFGYTYSTFVSWAYKTNSPGQPFRCVYYPIDGAYTGPSAADCNGPSGCMELVLGSGAQPAKMWMDTGDRVSANLGSAINTCMGKGGHLASERDYTEAIRLGLPNGSNTWVSTWDIGYGSYSVNTMIVRWTGEDTNFTDQHATYSTWDGLANARPFRCVWTNELR